MVESAVDNDPVYPVKVAAVQAEPCWFDVEAGVNKTCQLIAEAGANGAELVAFPELWIPGYPNFIYAHEQKTCNEYMRKYFRNAVSVQSEHMDRIRTAARDANIMVVIGIAERDKASLYMAQCFIGSDGNIILHRRKFKPTSYERILFGDSSGDCTTNVVQTPIGRVGGLQCFEHLQPLLKYHTYFQQEQIHVASWPNLFPMVGKMPFFNSVEACSMVTHTLAIEGGTFVLLASHTQSEKGLVANGLIQKGEAAHEGGSELPDDACHTAVTGGGFTEIIGPDGSTLAKAPSPSFEGLIYAHLDFNEIYLAKNIVDPVGQYSRTDLFTLQVNSNVNQHCVYHDKRSDFDHASRYSKLEASETETSRLPPKSKAEPINGFH